MNNLRMDWALENSGLLPSQPGQPRSSERSLLSLSSADRCGRLHRLCKLLQATCNRLQSVSGPLVPGMGPIAVVELPAGTTRKALADLAAAAVREALADTGLLEVAPPVSSEAGAAARRESFGRGGRWASVMPCTGRHRPHCARRHPNRDAVGAAGKLSPG